MGSGTAGVEVTFTITGSLFESWQSLSDIYFTGKNNNEEKEVGNGPILKMQIIGALNIKNRALPGSIQGNLFLRKNESPEPPVSPTRPARLITTPKMKETLKKLRLLAEVLH